MIFHPRHPVAEICQTRRGRIGARPKTTLIAEVAYSTAALPSFCFSGFRDSGWIGGSGKNCNRAAVPPRFRVLELHPGRARGFTQCFPITEVVAGTHEVLEPGLPSPLHHSLLGGRWSSAKNPKSIQTSTYSPDMEADLHFFHNQSPSDCSTSQETRAWFRSSWPTPSRPRPLGDLNSLLSR